MAQEPGLNSLLKWGIENSTENHNATDSAEAPRGGLNQEALRQLLGGPSDADLMKESMAVIINEDADLDNRLTAFDNLEQLVEGIDNANNMEPLGLWTPLIGQLDNKIADLRRMAAWCIGTAVQNNVKAQERFLALNGIPRLCEVALNDNDRATRKKAVYALSSSVRNYQPGFNEAVKYLPNDVIDEDVVDATDMDAVDAIMSKLRNRV